MSTMVSIEIPRTVLHATKLSLVEVRRELAITLFAQGKLSFGKARELAEMPVLAFQHLLASRNIPVHYAIEEYEEDIATLHRLGRICAQA